MVKEGKIWWKKHIEARYFSDVCIDRDSLAREFPRIMRRIKELQMEFIFAEPSECNLHMVREFCANLEVVFGSLVKESPFEPYKNTKRLSF